MLRQIIVALLLASVSSAATSISACGTLSAANTTYVLTQNISNNATCITIGANNITLDCAGYTMARLSPGGGTGIGISNRTNGTIKNCNIVNYAYGVNLGSGTSNISVSNISAYNNTYSIQILSSHGNSFSNIDASNSTEGIIASTSYNNSFLNISVHNNSYYGIYLSQCGNDRLSEISAYNNTRNGIYLQYETNGSIQDSFVYDNAVNGIYASASLALGGSNVSVSNVTISGNMWNGIYMDSFPNATLSNLIIYGNKNVSGAGVLVSVCPGISISNIHAYNNSGVAISMSIGRGAVLHNISVYNGTGSGGIVLNGINDSVLYDINVGNSTYGIYLANTNGNSLSNFTSYKNYFTGLYLTGGGGNTISGFSAYDNRYRGFLLQNGGNNSVRDFVAYNNSQYGAQLSFTKNNSVSNGTIHDSLGTAVYIESSPNASISNTLVYGGNNSSSYGVYIYASLNATLSNISIHDMSGSGIYLRNSNDSILYNVSVYNNSNIGLSATNSTYLNASYVSITTRQAQSNSKGISINGTAIEHYVHYFSNSYSDGRPIYSVVGQADATVPQGLSYILIANSMNITVSGQNLYKNGQGLVISNSSASIRNISASDSYSGIDLEFATNVSIDTATTYGANTCIYSYGSGATSISNSLIYDCAKGAYLINSNYSSVSNTSLHNNSFAFQAVSSSNLTIANANSSNNSNYGFSFNNSLANSVSNSLSCGNEMGGYYFTSDSTGNAGAGNYGNITDDDSNSGFYSSPCGEEASANSPVVSPDLPADGAKTNSSQVTLNWTAFNYTSNPACNVSRNSEIIFSDVCPVNSSCTTQNETPDATHFWNVTCYLGSESNISQTWSFIVDTTAPVASIQSPANSTYNSPSVGFDYASIDSNSGVDWCWYSLDGAGDVPVAGCANTSLSVGDGPHTLILYSNDTVGNQNLTSVSFTVDTAPPGLQYLPPTPSNNSYQNLAWVYVNISSPEDIQQALLEWNGTNESMAVSEAVAYRNKSSLADGDYAYKVYAQDIAGNWNVTEERAIGIGPMTGMKIILKNQVLAPLYLTGVELDDYSAQFEEAIKFEPGDKHTVSLTVRGSLCPRRGDTIQFDHVILYYTRGAIDNNVQSGTVPLMLRCS